VKVTPAFAKPPMAYEGLSATYGLTEIDVKDLMTKLKMNTIESDKTLI